MAKKKPNRNGQSCNNANTLRAFDIVSNIKRFKPLSDRQSEAWSRFFNDDSNLVMLGYPGTGKSYLMCHIASECLNQELVNSVKIIRSAVPSRDIGFLPGSESEKLSIYEKPYIPLFNDIFGRGDAYPILKHKAKISFESTSFLRSLTFDDTLIIVDEIQNMNFVELYSILTRVGYNSRIIFGGDLAQCDLKSTHLSGMENFINILSNMKNHFHVSEFGIDDVVRSDLVKEFLKMADKVSKRQ